MELIDLQYPSFHLIPFTYRDTMQEKHLKNLQGYQKIQNEIYNLI